MIDNDPPNTNSKDPQDEHENNSTIKVSRSDMRTHDIRSVFSKLGRPTTINNSKAFSENERPKRDDTDHLPNKILVNRSDGINHDIIQLIKGQSDARGETFKAQKSVSSINIRSFLSSGRIDVREALQKTASVPIQRASLNFSDKFTPRTVRIVHMSDTHNLLVKSEKFSFLPSGDILIHTGDFSQSGSIEEFAKFDSWLSSVKDLYHYRVVVIGARDVKELGNNWTKMKKLLPHATHVLCHEEVSILGIRIYGLPWHWGHKANYNLRSGAPSGGRFEDIPEGIHVLASHGPAYGRLDALGENGEHWGSKDLLEAVRRVKPGLHLHGHVHEGRGIIWPTGNLPLSINSCMTDPDKTVLYAAPHVIKADLLYIPPPSSNTSPSPRNPTDASTSSSSCGNVVNLASTSSDSNIVWSFKVGSLEK